jgi:hypothetical protein
VRGLAPDGVIVATGALPSRTGFSSKSSSTPGSMYTGAAGSVEGVDTVVLAAGQKANDELYFALKGTVANLHRIGDCLAPRKLDHAIYEGELAGRALWSPDERYIYEGELERWEEATVGVTV